MNAVTGGAVGFRLRAGLHVLRLERPTFPAVGGESSSARAPTVDPPRDRAAGRYQVFRKGEAAHRVPPQTLQRGGHSPPEAAR